MVDVVAERFGIRIDARRAVATVEPGLLRAAPAPTGVRPQDAVLHDALQGIADLPADGSLAGR